LYAARGRLVGWRALSIGRRTGLCAIGLVVVLPLVHMAMASAWIVARGNLVYDAEVDGGRGIWRGLHAEYDWLHEVFPMNALRITLLALLVVVAITLVLRRVDVVALGALASGALTLVFAAQAGVVANRYYIPAAALAVAALVISLARLPTAVQVVGLAVLAFAMYPTVRVAQNEVTSWTDRESASAELVDEVAAVHATGCPVAVGELDAESQAALPVLVAWERLPVGGACANGEVYVVLGPASGDGFQQACAGRGLEPLLRRPLGSVYRCARLGTEMVTDVRYGRVAPRRLVERRLLRPSLSPDE
jgi:hypothetical protein